MLSMTVHGGRPAKAAGKV